MPTQSKKKTSVKAKSESASTKKTPESEKIRLSKLISKHKKTVQDLAAQISNLESLKESRDALQLEVGNLSENVAKAQGEPMVQPNGMADDFWWKAVPSIQGSHRSIVADRR